MALNKLGRGLKGAQGAKGLRGPKGHLGPKGKGGQGGSQGPRGASGRTGRRGKPGRPGNVGAKGVTGLPQDSRVLDIMETYFADVYTQLDIQMRHLAQLQTQLEALPVMVRRAVAGERDAPRTMPPTPRAEAADAGVRSGRRDVARQRP